MRADDVRGPGQELAFGASAGDGAGVGCSEAVTDADADGDGDTDADADVRMQMWTRVPVGGTSERRVSGDGVGRRGLEMGTRMGVVERGMLLAVLERAWLGTL